MIINNINYQLKPGTQQYNGLLSVEDKAKLDRIHEIIENATINVSNSEVIEMIGTLSELDTNQKNNLVASINSLKAELQNMINNTTSSDGGSAIAGIVDNQMSDDSDNAVSNKVIKKYVDDLISNHNHEGIYAPVTHIHPNLANYSHTHPEYEKAMGLRKETIDNSNIVYFHPMNNCIHTIPLLSNDIEIYMDTPFKNDGTNTIHEGKNEIIIYIEVLEPINVSWREITDIYNNKYGYTFYNEEITTLEPGYYDIVLNYNPLIKKWQIGLLKTIYEGDDNNGIIS